MKVYVVTAEEGIMSVCGNEETANWEKDLFERNGYKDVSITSSGVIKYDENFYKSELNMIGEDDE